MMNLEAHYRKRAIDRIDAVLIAAARAKRLAVRATDLEYLKGVVSQLTHTIRTDAHVALDALHRITPRQED